jgi:hypothetical protein
VIEAIEAGVPFGPLPADLAALGSVLALAAALRNEWVWIHPH